MKITIQGAASVHVGEPQGGGEGVVFVGGETVGAEIAALL